MTPAEFWSGKRVFVTGHTGFKGAWLAIVLRELGAEVTGFALPPPTQPNLFDLSGIAGRIDSIEGDVRDPIAIARAVDKAAPGVVFHLAAQALVRRSYEDPVETYGTNVMGTLHLLEAVRKTSGIDAAVIVTSDKCYDNREWVWPYREEDRLGGSDPYSSSKGCAELLVDSYRRSFFSRENRGAAVATARAGNVVGGGDFAEDRLIPDLVRSAADGKPAMIRNPSAIRPWQHVLDALGGYLLLAERLTAGGGEYVGAWNFGPAPDACREVADVANTVTQSWPGGPTWRRDGGHHPAESHLLSLDSSKARRKLGWEPRWSADEAIDRTVTWYRSWMREGSDQIATLNAVRADLREWGLPSASAAFDEQPVPIR